MRGTRSRSVGLKRTGSRGGKSAYVGKRGRRAGRRGENVAIDLVVQDQFRGWRWLGLYMAHRL